MISEELELVVVGFVGSDQYVGVLCSVKFLEDTGSKTQREKEVKAETKPEKKK
ncbi:MAG: hypothetical protein HQ517_04845 [SAR324 cluster bacterium]|nr:hypothetical protein [SAR324 cluster bacterium]